MNKMLIAIVTAVGIVLAFLAIMGTRVNGPVSTETPTDESEPYYGTPSAVSSYTPKPSLISSPTPEALTPAKEQMTDLETEGDSLAVDQSLDADITQLDKETKQ